MHRQLFKLYVSAGIWYLVTNTGRRVEHIFNLSRLSEEQASLLPNNGVVVTSTLDEEDRAKFRSNPHVSAAVALMNFLRERPR